MIQRVAPTNAMVLIRGESGVGKELIANAIHNHSRRKDKPYRTINCGALYRELLESELFGHERGAFTGAPVRRLGLFEQANGGTLLLDEVGEMGPETQVKFLRVLEGQEFTRLGGDRPIKTDVRIIAATNANLEEAVKNGKFRNDLYHRINRFPIRVPPLRERREDIPLLVSAFIKEFSKEHDRPISGITPQAMNYLKNADWDGNIRELRNTIENAIILARTETLQLDDVYSQDVQEVCSNHEENSASPTAPIKELFEQPIIVFCQLCANRNLNLNQLKKWIESDGIEVYRPFVDQAHTDIDIASWQRLSRENRIERLMNIVPNAIDHISNLLNIEVPITVSIRGRILDQCVMEVFSAFAREYESEAEVAKALGLGDFKNDVNLRKKRIHKWLNSEKELPCERELDSFPDKDLNTFLTYTVYEFLGLPTSRRQISFLARVEKLRTVRIALAIFVRRLEGDHGVICMGGMNIDEIENEIYRRATYLYGSQKDISSALDRNERTVRKKLNRWDFPSEHTLF